MLLNLGSLSIPFLFSFHPKLKFYKKWRSLLPALIITMLVFIPWDVVFTDQGFWGFNPNYYLGSTIFGLPIEEWLFFICIPYACVFTHYALGYYFKNFKLSFKWTKYIGLGLAILLLVILSFNYDRWYTLINFGLGVILILIGIKTNIELLRRFFCTFLVMLIPFFIVNGILTGSAIESEVVWYNDAENLGIRMGTIPVEDSIYAFSMIFMNLLLLEFFESRLFGNQTV